jgi:hypothetical protein
MAVLAGSIQINISEGGTRRITVSGRISGRDRKESSSVGKKANAPGGSFDAVGVGADVVVVAGLELVGAEAGVDDEGAVAGLSFESETYQPAT